MTAVEPLVERVVLDTSLLVGLVDRRDKWHPLALGCREFEIRWVASFDGDFDRIPWLTRLADPDSVAGLLEDEGV